MTRRDDLVRLRDAVAEVNGKMHDIMCLPDAARLDVAQQRAADASRDLCHSFVVLSILIAQEDAAQDRGIME